jgi:3-deoxy-D-manno-octulosonate 8-phosphate phosphatase (KDO 8-P phosphatase)
MLDRLGIGWDSVAMVADDLPDLAVLRRVGFPVAVANAQPEVRHMAAWRTEAMGGHGAVREFARAILLARGQWDRLVEEYVAQRDGGERG